MSYGNSATRAGAQGRLELPVEFDESAYGPDHPEVATTLRSLGRGLRDLGDLARDRERLEFPVGRTEALYGADHSQGQCCVARDSAPPGTLAE